MTTQITHAKVSAMPDGSDADQVRPSDWNADHDVALDAGDVTIADAGAYFDSTDVEGALQELGAGGGAASFAGVRAGSNADTTVANATWTAIPLASETFDTGSYHNPASNNSRITAGATGYFVVHAMFSWRNSTNGGVRYGQIYKNGSGYSALFGAHGGSISDNDPTHAIVDIIPVVATDYIELFAWQLTGGNLNAYAANVAVQFVPA